MTNPVEGLCIHSQSYHKQYAFIYFLKPIVITQINHFTI